VHWLDASDLEGCMKSVKGIFVATALAVLFACESDRALDPLLDGEGPVDARSPQTVEAPSLNLTPVTETRIDLIWSDVSNETRYELYRADSASGVFTLLATTNAGMTTYSDVNANPVALNCYKVRAVRTQGSRTLYSEFSNVPCVWVSPTAPSNVTATLSSNQITVAWQDNSNIETAFQVFVSDNDYGAFALRTTTAANVVSYVDGGLTAGLRFCYRVRAYRTVTTTYEGGSSTAYLYSTESNTACASVPLPSQPPAVSFQLYATPFSSSGVDVITQLISPETQPQSSAYQIRLERSLDGGSSWSTVSGYTTQEYGDFGLNPEARVCYRVIASNEVGDGQPSNTACTTPPAGPTNLTMTSIDPQSVELTWRDNSAVEDGYQVWMTYGHGSCSCGAGACNADWYEDSWIVAQLPANTTRYVAPPLYGDVCTPTTTSYYIVATKDGGTSDWSNAVSWQPASSP
jgi:hypothetical protein